MVLTWATDDRRVDEVALVAIYEGVNPLTETPESLVPSRHIDESLYVQGENEAKA